MRSNSRLSRAIQSAIVVALASLALSSASTAQSDTAAATYTRYTRPGQCVGLGRRLLSFYWRDKRADTVYYAPETDSIPAPVAHAIRACATRFSEATTAPRELIDLLNLQLWLGDLAAARTLETKVMAAQRSRTPVEQGWMLFRIFGMYLSAKPARVADAHRVLAQLDAMNVPAAPWRVLAHADMIDYDLGANKVADAVGHGRAAVTANHTMTRNDRADRTLEMWETWKSYAEATSIQSGGPAAVQVLDTASADLVPLLGPPSIGATLDGGASQHAFPRGIAEAKYPYEVMGTTPSPIEATHWLDARNDSTVRPKPKTVTLVTFVAPNCGGDCFPRYATLRRLYNKYHAMGLQVVLLTKTEGAFKRHPFPQPSAEVTQLDHYILDFLKLPGVVGLLETKFAFIPDGRRSDTPWPSQQAYIHGRNTAIVGKDGVVKLVTSIGPVREQLLDAQLAAAFSAP